MNAEDEDIPRPITQILALSDRMSTIARDGIQSVTDHGNIREAAALLEQMAMLADRD